MHGAYTCRSIIISLVLLVLTFTLLSLDQVPSSSARAGDTDIVLPNHLGQRAVVDKFVYSNTGAQIVNQHQEHTWSQQARD